MESKIKKIELFDDGYHQMMLDVERYELFKMTSDWCNEIVKDSPNFSKFQNKFFTFLKLLRTKD
jgi:hypothetical protein